MRKRQARGGGPNNSPFTESRKDSKLPPDHRGSAALVSEKGQRKYFYPAFPGEAGGRKKRKKSKKSKESKKRKKR